MLPYPARAPGRRSRPGGALDGGGVVLAISPLRDSSAPFVVNSPPPSCVQPGWNHIAWRSNGSPSTISGSQDIFVNGSLLSTSTFYGDPLASHRWENGGAGDDVVVVANFSNVPLPNLNIGFPRGGPACCSVATGKTS
jgi:hypothetical protein